MPVLHPKQTTEAGGGEHGAEGERKGGKDGVEAVTKDEGGGGGGQAKEDGGKKGERERIAAGDEVEGGKGGVDVGVFEGNKFASYRQFGDPFVFSVYIGETVASARRR